MLHLRVAVATRPLAMPLKKALLTVAEMGAQGVQIDLRNELRPEELSQTGLRQLRKMLDDLNLRVAAVTFPTRRSYFDPAELDRRVEATKTAMNFAHKLGASAIVCRLGPLEELADDEDAGQLFTQVVLDLGMHSHHCGTHLAAKTGSESPQVLHDWIDRLPEGTLGVDFDPGNLIAAGYEVSEALDLLGPHLRHVTASDAVQTIGQSSGTAVQLGRGSTDLPELLGGLEEHGYQDWITVGSTTTDQPARELHQAVQYLESLELG